MAVGLDHPTTLLPIEGIELATTEAGIRYQDRDDMVLMTLCAGAVTAGVFTTNKYCAAPVSVAKRNIETTAPRALLINAGNANAGTGQQGLDNALASCAHLATRLDLEASSVLPFSTGVIGEQLPMQELTHGVDKLVEGLQSDNWLCAAKAIMTTDTVAKGASRQIEIGGHVVTLTGIAKGSGMICPDMATMLSYVATDADITQEVLSGMLTTACDASFNRITVDSDTSTNDALVLIATAKSQAPKIDTTDSDEAKAFYAALQSIFVELATSIVRDGEGATKFVRINVSGGINEADCSSIAYSVAHSPLVKTALFASDPNWGRILAAIGKASVSELALDRVAIKINQLPVIEGGEPAVTYTEQAGQVVFSEPEITIDIDLNLGGAEYHVWTTDLSHDYVSINADYRS